ncbi:MAG: N-acetylmuramoyl-L-alanine amidase [Firmicutes bacterium]|nr:N-acetylmuramoyl-L-alanine amidase [Bacillota bacterium]
MTQCLFGEHLLLPQHPSATEVLVEAEKTAAIKHLPGHRLRADFSDWDPDIEVPYYILKHTLCAAVLTENGFMDSPLSLAFLESDEGKKAIITLHVDGIIDFINQRANEPL